MKKLFKPFFICFIAVFIMCGMALTAIAEGFGSSEWTGTGIWTKTADDNGYITITQTQKVVNAKYGSDEGMALDGLSIDATFNTQSGFCLTNSETSGYGGGGISILINNSGWGFGYFTLSSGNSDSQAKFYQTAEDALIQKNIGGMADGQSTKSIVFAKTTPVNVVISFEKYSTYRYKVTFTSESFYGGMVGLSSNKLIYYINTKDFENLFSNPETGEVKFVAQGNDDGNASIKIKITQDAPAETVIEDPADIYLKDFTENPITADSGKYVVTTKNENFVKIGNSVANVNENGSISVTNPEAGWGDRTGLDMRLKLDGLKLTSYYSEMSAEGRMAGLALCKNNASYYDEGNLCMSYFVFVSGQTRLYIGNNHDFYGNSFESYLYKTKDAALSKSAEQDAKHGSLIIEGIGIEYSLEFEKETDSVYKVTIELLNGVSWHWIHGFSDAKKLVAYMNTDEIQNLFDEYGFSYLTGITNYTKKEAGTMAFYVQQPVGHITSAEISLENEILTYNGNAQTPSVTSVKSGDEVISADNYDVSYKENTKVGSGKVIVTFKNGYSGVAAKSFFINSINAVGAKIKLEYDTISYTTMELTPTAEVYLGDDKIDSKHYTVKYSDNINVGTATVTVTFKGNYSGTSTSNFQITKILESKTGKNITLTYEESSYAKMIALTGNYTYTVKDESDKIINVESKINSGKYNVTAILETATKITTVSYQVTVEDAVKPIDPVPENPEPLAPIENPKTGCSSSSNSESIFLLLATIVVVSLKLKKINIS